MFATGSHERAQYVRANFARSSPYPVPTRPGSSTYVLTDPSVSAPQQTAALRFAPLAIETAAAAPHHPGNRLESEDQPQTARAVRGAR